MSALALRLARTPRAMAVVIQFVRFDFAAQRVAVYTELLRGARLIAAHAIEHRLDKALFKFADGFVKLNAMFHHLRY
jgi:hypothetical protein